MWRSSLLTTYHLSNQLMRVFLASQWILRHSLRGRPSFSSFSQAYKPYAGGEGLYRTLRTLFQIIKNYDRHKHFFFFSKCVSDYVLQYIFRHFNSLNNMYKGWTFFHHDDSLLTFPVVTIWCSALFSWIWLWTKMRRFLLVQLELVYWTGGGPEKNVHWAIGQLLFNGHFLWATL
jgi:hypothetical protein